MDRLLPRLGDAADRAAGLAAAHGADCGGRLDSGRSAAGFPQ